MSEFPSNSDQNSINFRESDLRGPSNLQATAPDYYPPNQNQGAVRKKYKNHYGNRGTNSYQNRNVQQQSNLHPDAQEFYPSNSESNSSVRKKYPDKNPRNWRSSSTGYDVPYYDDSSRSRSFKPNSSYNGKKSSYNEPNGGETSSYYSKKYSANNSRYESNSVDYENGRNRGRYQDPSVKKYVKHTPNELHEPYESNSVEHEYEPQQFRNRGRYQDSSAKKYVKQTPNESYEPNESNSVDHEYEPQQFRNRGRYQDSSAKKYVKNTSNESYEPYESNSVDHEYEPQQFRNRGRYQDPSAKKYVKNSNNESYGRFNSNSVEQNNVKHTSNEFYNRYADSYEYNSLDRGYSEEPGVQEKSKKYSSNRGYNSRRPTNNYDNYYYEEPLESNENNRRFRNNYKSNTTNKNKITINKNKILATAGQRERLTEMIDGNLLECMVCCEKIKRTDKVWSCFQCYHIVHLNCIAAWAKSSEVDQIWRCPACQNTYTEIPNQYLCYCGQVLDPKLNPNIIAHGCDNMCLKKGKQCEHKCNLLCHPGPCPECNVMVSKPCGCGLTQQVVKCCSDIKITCDSLCNKLLNCGLHRCKETCHVGLCSPCAEKITQECFCGKTGRRVVCDEDNIGKTTFACENVCDKLLACGIHKCQMLCHSGDCGLCEADVNLIKSCHCGKTPLECPRGSCLDPIPCCDKVCGKTLICGPPSKPHWCKEKCHKGKCPPCPLTTIIRCRCGHMDKELACQKLTTKADDARCEKKCTKKRLCGKHTCKQKCCIEIEHLCPLPCNKLLTCGLHKCQFTCHSGRCPTCMETSFEELFCTCGASVLYPPVPCGTKLPVCDKPCAKPRPCGHPANHECHPGNCPACFVLTKQWCFGGHEQRAAIPCQQKSFSCGLACGKPMPCGRHKCNKPCHEGKCPTPCNQPCTVPRDFCGHPCNKPCHDGSCPDTNCKQMVPVTCLCGLQKTSRICMDLIEEFRNLEMSQLKDRISNLTHNETVDINITIKKPTVLKILECTDECRIQERNRRLAIGLQIQNPDLSQKLTPRYSDFLKQWAKKDAKFCQRVHDKLSELVQLAKQSKQKSRSYSFESMNRDKRHFIHEYCEYFGMESAAYDAEPNRNVVATAIKDKSWLPGMSLLEVLQRENGQRKVPGPVLGYTGESETMSSLKLLTSAK